ncbi:MAG: hypothetical protein EU551_00635 [Promethearchaeota archaeon]|nr:MAG: hypothetical protein EU551_00635 [Candidatus Lokiarchaeota archaeon]
MKIKTSRKKIRYFLLVSLLFLIFLSPVISTNAQSDEYLGNSEYTFYLDGAFTGEAERTLAYTTQSITTYFGTFENVSIVTRTDLKVTHSSKGYFEIKDSKSYYDEDFNLIMSQSTWNLRVSGYVQTSWVSKYEYGNYQVLQDTNTTYEETYDLRYYEDGSYQESTFCRDLTIFELIENISVPAGTFECLRTKTTFYEDYSYEGYGRSWIDAEGWTIQQKTWDVSNDLWAEIKLISKTPSEQIPGFNFSIVFLLIAVMGIVIFITKDRRFVL